MTEVQHSEQQNLQFLNKVLSWQPVTKLLASTKDFVQSQQKSGPGLVKRTIEAVDATYKAVAPTIQVVLQPVVHNVEQFAKQSETVHRLDNFACKQFERLEGVRF